MCHWNPNSLTAHNLSELTWLKVYNSIYKHDHVCLSETYLDSANSATSDSLLKLEGYNLVPADHPDNIKRG